MQPLEFAEYYKAEFQQYVNSVLDDTRTAGRLEKLAVERWVNLYLKKYYFNENDFTRILRFISLINVESVINKGKISQVKLAPWQLLTLAHYCLYDDKDSDKKVITTISLSQAGKNGKSTLAVFISLMASLVDGRINANIPILCVSQKQANQVLDYFKQIIKASPALRPFFKILHSTIVYSDDTTTNKIMVLANDPEKVQAFKIAIGILDEIFLYDEQEAQTIDIVKSKQDATYNPLTFVIGTFSTKEHYNYENYYLPCINILEGMVEDDSHFILFCSQDSLDEVDNPESWLKSNPSLGVAKDLQTLVKKYKETRIFPSKLDLFKRETLNFWQEAIAEDRFLTDELVNNIMKRNEPIPLGSKVIIGVDLSSNTDINSIAILHEENGVFNSNIINIIPNVEKNFVKGDFDCRRYFVNDLEAFKDNNYLPDDETNPNGYIIPSTSPVLDVQLIEDIIVDLSNKYVIEAVTYDNYNSAQVIYRLINRGIYCIPVKQNLLTQNEPIKFMERLILLDKGLFNIIRNPFVKWQARNLLLYRDINNNVKFIKRTRKGVPLSIDSWSALLNCMVYWTEENKDKLAGFSAMLDAFDFRENDK